MTQLEHWPGATWDDAFANTAHIPGGEALLTQIAQDAIAYRASCVGLRPDLPYGPTARETYDLVMPDKTPRGLAVFVHGGYWRTTAPDMWTQYAEGARARGYAVCLPGYTLAPESSLSQIAQQVACAIETVAAQIDGPICLSGHSAGGQLVARLCCDDQLLSDVVWQRLRHVLSISGVHDLRPLRQTAMNRDLQLDVAEAARESPILHHPRKGTRITAWVGGAERPEFLRQAQMLPLLWKGLGAQTAHVIAPDQNHFTVLDGLKHPDSPITRAFLQTHED